MSSTKVQELMRSEDPAQRELVSTFLHPAVEKALGLKWL